MTALTEKGSIIAEIEAFQFRLGGLSFEIHFVYLYAIWAFSFTLEKD